MPEASPKDGFMRLPRTAGEKDWLTFREDTNPP